MRCDFLALNKCAIAYILNLSASIGLAGKLCRVGGFAHVENPGVQKKL